MPQSAIHVAFGSIINWTLCKSTNRLSFVKCSSYWKRDARYQFTWYCSADCTSYSPDFIGFVDNLPLLWWTVLNQFEHHLEWLLWRGNAMQCIECSKLIWILNKPSQLWLSNRNRNCNVNVDALKSSGVHSNIILNDGAATIYAALFESQIMCSLCENIVKRQDRKMC